MALTYTVNYRQGQDTLKGVGGTFDCDADYRTGGYLVTRALGFLETTFSLECGAAGGYVFHFNPATQRLLAYRQTNATSALIEVPDHTSLIAVTGVPFWALGR